MRGPRLLAAAAVVSLLAVSACTSDASPEPEPLPSDPTTSASPSPSPSATPPTLPAEAEGTSAKAAKAFARHYFDAVNYAAATGDTEDLRDLGTPNCVSCDAIATNIEKVYETGGYIESENWQIRNLRVLQSTKRRAVVSIGAFLAPEVTVGADGDRTRREGGRQPMTMIITPSGSIRQVARLDLVT